MAKGRRKRGSLAENVKAVKTYFREKSKSKETAKKVERVQAYRKAAFGKGKVGAGMSAKATKGKMESDQRARAAARRRKGRKR